MRPQSIEQWLYQNLMSSPHFLNWVKRIHARINKLPLDNEPIKLVNSYNPTPMHKFKAFRVIWWDELKKLFTFRG